MGPHAYQRVLAESRLAMPRVEQMGRVMFENLFANRRAIRAAA